MKEELFKFVSDIEGFEEYTKYVVTSCGRVISLNKGLVGELKPFRTSKGFRGYNLVLLQASGKKKFVLVHRLVAMAFIPNPKPNEWQFVNHKDENKMNNNVENLEWCDAAYNANYGTKGERASAAMRNHKSISKPIDRYTLDGKYIDTFPSSYEAQRVLNIQQQNIGKCCLGKRNKAGGYIWKYNSNNG